MSILQKIVIDKSYWWLRHFLFWLIIYLDVFTYIYDYTPELKAELINDLFNLGLDVLLVYFNIYYLLPKFALNDKIIQYSVFTFLTLLLVCGINVYSESLLYTEEDEGVYSYGWSMYYTGLFTLSVLAPAIAIKIAKYFYHESTKRNELEKHSLKSELNYLKKQINPHFLFNSLNNIYIMAKEKSEKTPETILQISDLMRYQTYDAAKEKVRLSKEIEFLDNYLMLEQIRRDNLQIKSSVVGNVDTVLIEPLLFLPFVENACKYSAKTDGTKEEIHISWTRSETSLSFNIDNEKGYIPQKSEHSGFGLENVKKRLELLYADKYTLNIDETDLLYSVDLRIQL